MTEPSPPPVSTAPVLVPARASVLTFATDAVEALKASPVLLLIVLLNGFFCAAAAYYLLQVETYRAQDRATLAGLLKECLTETVPIKYLTHNPKE